MLPSNFKLGLKKKKDMRHFNNQRYMDTRTAPQIRRMKNIIESRLTTAELNRLMDNARKIQIRKNYENERDRIRNYLGSNRIQGLRYEVMTDLENREKHLNDLMKKMVTQ